MSSLQVLMPVFNASETLAEALDSLLVQTHRDFRLLIADDASTDDSVAVVKRYMRKDDRIDLIEAERNCGIIETRNSLFKAADAPIVALMDADDICLPHRLQRQWSFLQKNPRIAAVGSGVQHFGAIDSVYIPPGNHNKIMTAMTLGCAVLNPSVMLRRDKLLEHNIFCDPNYRGAADYDMWLRLGKVERLANLEEVLLKYRNHSAQESSANLYRQRARHIDIVQRELAEVGIEAPKIALRALIWPRHLPDGLNIVEAGELVDNVMLKYVAARELSFEVDVDELYTAWDFRFRGICRRNGLRGLACYLKTRGLTAMTRGKHYGASFVWDCLTRTQ